MAGCKLADLFQPPEGLLQDLTKRKALTVGSGL